MANDETGRESGGKSDDLFEDLDRFFATIDESEWPESEEAVPLEPDEEGAVVGRGVAPGSAAGAPEEEPAPEPEAIPEAELEADSIIEPAAASGDDASGEGPEPSPSAPPISEPLPTGEMTTEEWPRLRDVLGEEGEEEEDFEFTDVPTELGPEEGLSGYAAEDEPEAAPEPSPAPEPEPEGLTTSESGRQEASDMSECEPPQPAEGA